MGFCAVSLNSCRRAGDLCVSSLRSGSSLAREWVAVAEGPARVSMASRESRVPEPGSCGKAGPQVEIRARKEWNLMIKMRSILSGILVREKKNTFRKKVYENKVVGENEFGCH